jgi:aldehyde:ferredoxin oxidoreductase
MEYLSAGKILIVDLGAATVKNEALTDQLVEKKIGGAAITRYLYDQHADADPIVIGTGLLTGTLFPASAAAVITAKSPVTGNVCHCPITLKAGLEIQFSGFDYIVIRGKSAKPVFLWIHDGVADITDAADVWGKDVWDTTAAWRKAMGDELIQTLLIGPAGEQLSDLAQVCTNYWGGADRWGFGKSFGLKNLKGLAFRGMGLLEISDAEEFVEFSLDILEEVKEGSFVGRAGIGDIAEAIGESGVNDWLSPIVHRHSACYNTPYPMNTFVFLDEDPKKFEEPETEEPGFLITDVFGLIGFKKAGFDATATCRLLKACARYGIDAVGVAEQSLALGKTSLEEITASFPAFTGVATRPGKGIFSPWCPMQPLFGQFEAAGDDPAAWWERRMAVAYIFGIHPMFALMSPELVEDDLLEIASVGTGLALTAQTLDNAIASLVP